MSLFLTVVFSFSVAGCGIQYKGDFEENDRGLKYSDRDMSEFAGNASVEYLMGYLDSGSRNDRLIAITALGKKGPEASKAVPELLKMTHPVVGREEGFLEGIGWSINHFFWYESIKNYPTPAIYGDPLAHAEHNKKFAKTEDTNTRMAVLEALGSIGDPRAVPVLLGEVRDSSSVVYGWEGVILNTLTKMGAPAVDALAGLIREDLLGLSLRATEALKKVKDHKAVPYLMKLTEDQNDLVRGSAASALGNMPPTPEILAKLEKLLNEYKHPYVQTCAASAIGRLSTTDGNAIPVLIRATYSTGNGVCSSAVRTLGEIGPGAKQSIPRLEELVKNDRGYIGYDARKALKAIRGTTN